MAIRHGLLALLSRGPRYGYQLRTEFESRTGSTWPLNIGQVYTTLGRLERDGLVVPAGAGRAGHALYAITEAGLARLRRVVRQPVDRADPPRNELAIKLAMAVGSPAVDVRAVIQAQRTTPCAPCRTTPGSRRRRWSHRQEPSSPTGRRGLAVGPRPADLPGRGRGALARPLRGRCSRPLPGAAKAPRPPLLADTKTPNAENPETHRTPKGAPRRDLRGADYRRPRAAVPDHSASRRVRPPDARDRPVGTTYHAHTPALRSAGGSTR